MGEDLTLQEEAVQVSDSRLSESSQRSFEKDGFLFVVENIPNLASYRVLVTVPVLASKAARKSACTSVSAGVKIPGFRAGKAPESMLLKACEKEIHKEWLKSVALKAFDVLSSDLSVEVWRNTFFYQGSPFKEGEPAVVELKFEYLPSVPSVELSKLILPQAMPLEVSDEQVAEAEDQVSFMLAAWNAVKDRPVQNGDFVNVNIRYRADDGAESATGLKEVRFEVGGKRTPLWLSKELVGRVAGESFDAISQPDPDDPEGYNFPEKPVTVAIVSHLEAKLPDREHLFDLMKVDSQEGLSRGIRAVLIRNIEEENEKRVFESLEAQLLALYPFSVPPALVEEELKVRLNMLMKDPEAKAEFQGGSDSERRMAVEYAARAAKSSLQLLFLYEKMAREFPLVVSKDPSDPKYPAALRDTALRFCIQHAKTENEGPPSEESTPSL